MVFAVFKDEDAFFLKQIFLKDQVGYCRQFLQGVGRVGKDKVKLLFARFDKPEDIASERCHKRTVPL